MKVSGQWSLVAGHWLLAYGNKRLMGTGFQVSGVRNSELQKLTPETLFYLALDIFLGRQLKATC